MAANHSSGSAHTQTEAPALVEAAVAGDRVALERLLLAHYDELAEHITARLPSRLQATQAVEDILQIAFCQAFRDIAGFQPREGATFGAWLATIANNRLLDAIKQHDVQKRGGNWQRISENVRDESRVLSLLEWIATDDPSPSSIVARDEALHALHVALASLAPDERDAIRLRLLEGKSLEETAAELGRTADAIRGLVHRGKEHLQATMGRASHWLKGNASMIDKQPETVELDRAAQVRLVIDNAISRRARGDDLTDDAICEQNPSLMPEIAAELNKLRLIARARNQSLAEESGGAGTHETAAFVPARRKAARLSRSLHIRCPLCHEPLEIAADQSLDDVECSACHGRFGLAGDDPNLKEQKAVTQIGHFELIERLGMGGFGTVWKARDTKLDRTVALKIPRSQSLNDDEVEEFLHEARVAARLRHPNIVSVHEIGRDGDAVYIVSDLVDGVSLDKFKATKKLSHSEAAQLVASICDALHFAHQAGVVHRDLKPDNILIDSTSQPHITDFGLAKKSQNEVEINIEGEILGTPAYMSPEQARGEAHLADRRTDVYSLGVMLFELLTDFLPFRGNVMMLAHHAVNTEPPNPRSLNPSISRDLETICLKCLEKIPERRYASAHDLSAELRRFLAGDAILARPISRPARLWRWVRKNPRIPALSTALFLVVLTAYGVAWFWLNSRLQAADDAFTIGALAGVEFGASAIAATAGQNFNKYYDHVEQAARDPVLIAALLKIIADLDENARYAPLFSDPDPQVDLSKRRDELREDPLRQPLKVWTNNLPLTGELPIFAWFVLLPDGTQIARNSEDQGGGKTIGENYSWRSYHHSGPSDFDKSWRAGADQHITGTHLCPPFRTEHTDEYVVVVSTPVYRDPVEKQGFLGVVGLMISLGSFPGLPGNADHPDAASLTDSSFAVMVDSREGHEGQVLQHPLYIDLESEPDWRQQLLDDSKEPQLRAKSGDWRVDPNYPDPFRQQYPYYGQRWLAGQQPVMARGKDTRLRIIVQESYEVLIGRPLTDLRRGLILLSLATLLLASAVIIPLWALILRLVR